MTDAQIPHAPRPPAGELGRLLTMVGAGFEGDADEAAEAFAVRGRQRPRRLCGVAVRLRQAGLAGRLDAAWRIRLSGEDGAARDGDGR